MRQIISGLGSSNSKGDMIRVVGRRLVPTDIYRQISKFLNMWAVVRSEGPATWKLLNHFDGESITHQFQSLKYPFSFRRVKSHVGVIVQNVFRREYDHFPSGYKPRVIIDGGAFIGDLTCLWASEFPDARIIGLEPNVENFELASQNSRPFGERVTLLQSGLWSECCRLNIDGTERGARVSVCKKGRGMVDAVGLGTLLKKFSLDSVDILKLDIEGAEKEVLSERCIAWLDRISCIIGEFHGKEIQD
jgi:FkbM family methyltransferase